MSLWLQIRREAGVGLTQLACEKFVKSPHRSADGQSAMPAIVDATASTPSWETDQQQEGNGLALQSIHAPRSDREIPSWQLAGCLLPRFPRTAAANLARLHLLCTWPKG
jgi:hypothetical protein